MAHHFLDQDPIPQLLPGFLRVWLARRSLGRLLRNQGKLQSYSPEYSAHFGCADVVLELRIRFCTPLRFRGQARVGRYYKHLLNAAVSRPDPTSPKNHSGNQNFRLGPTKTSRRSDGPHTSSLTLTLPKTSYLQSTCFSHGYP